MSSWNFKKLDWFGVLSFFLPLLVYLFTLAPSIQVEDNAEFITAAATLGIAHPSGYPTFVLLGKLFTLLPFGSIPWRVNFMSAVFGALTCLVLYWLIKHLVKSKIIALVSVLVLAFSLTFWSQSIVAEVYTLNGFFVVLSLYLLIRWQAERSNKLLYWLAFLVGLGAGNHELILLLLPVYLLFVLLTVNLCSLGVKTVFTCLGLFILGLSVYLFMPLRSLTDPLLDWGNTGKSFINFWHHVTRNEYNDFNLFSNLGSKFALLTSFFSALPREFSWPAVILILVGFFASWRNWRVGFLLFGSLFSQSALIILLRKFGWGMQLEYMYSVYYLGAYVVMLVYFALALLWLKVFFQDRIVINFKSRCYLNIAALIVIFCLPLWLGAANWQQNDLSKNNFVDNYSRTLLNSLQPNAVLLLKNDGFVGDTELFSVMYLQFVEKFRPDVSVLDDASIFKVPPGFPPLSAQYLARGRLAQRTELLRLAWSYSEAKNRPLYTTFPVEAIKEIKLYSRATGVSYQVLDSEKEARSISIRSQWSVNFDLSTVSAERLSEQNLAAHYLYLQSGFFVEHGKNEELKKSLLSAINYDALPFSTEYSDFIAHRTWWNSKSESY